MKYKLPSITINPLNHVLSIFMQERILPDCLIEDPSIIQNPYDLLVKILLTKKPINILELEYRFVKEVFCSKKF